MAKIFGYCPGNVQTAKAVRVTIIESDGEAFNADTTWLPRSICEALEVRRVENDDGTISHEVRATVPEWWMAKQDTRPRWQRLGMTSIPYATRPW